MGRPSKPHKLNNLSFKAIGCVSVGPSDCLFICLFPRSSETADPNELKFSGNNSLGARKILKCRFDFLPFPPLLVVNNGYHVVDGIEIR